MPDLPKLSLRAFTEDDGPVLMGVLGAPEVAPWLLPAGRAQAHSEAECAARARAGAAHWRAHGFGPWIVGERGRTVACGGLGLRLLDGRPELELRLGSHPRRVGSRDRHRDRPRGAHARGRSGGAGGGGAQPRRQLGLAAGDGQAGHGSGPRAPARRVCARAVSRAGWHRLTARAHTDGSEYLRVFGDCSSSPTSTSVIT